MEIREISAEEYASIFDSYAPHVYNTVAFTELNRNRAEALHYLTFFDGSKPRIGITLGQRGDILRSPFSAPFGGFSQRKEQSAEHIFKAVELLHLFSKEKNLKIKITLPPYIYAPSLTALSAAALSHYGTLKYTDVSYHRPLIISKQASASFSPKARNKWRIASCRDIAIEEFTHPTKEQMLRTYNVIHKNHCEQNHPLSMTFDQVRQTAPIVNAFVFIASKGEDLAAALVYPSSSSIAQVIYWGDTLAARPTHVMTLLAATVMDKVRDRGFKILDLGPASSSGTPDCGLCRFKESLGCIATSKPTFVL